jgi:hypothetical protein
MRAILALAILIAQDPGAVVHVEFRVFAGTEEITATTRVRVMRTGTREKPITVLEGKPLQTSLAAGIYDVQALRMRPEGIIAIKWSERLVMMRYPDEGGRHLQVINFDRGYGALQLRAADGPIDAYAVDVFPAGTRTDAAAPLAGPEYRLFILRAGRYDIRVRHAGADRDTDAHWLLDVEVPADRTRMKRIEAAG